MGLPNWITTLRLLAIPGLLYWLPQATDQARWWCVAIFLLASATDWLDGYLARRLNQVTELGKFLDPLVDKLLVMAPLLVLVQRHQVPVWAVFIILGRELTIAGWRVMPASQIVTVSGQVSNQQDGIPGANIPGANQWGKAKTVCQILAITLLMAPLPANWEWIGNVSFWIALGLTVISGVIYLWPALFMGSDLVTTA